MRSQACLFLQANDTRNRARSERLGFQKLDWGFAPWGTVGRVTGNSITQRIVERTSNPQSLQKYTNFR